MFLHILLVILFFIADNYCQSQENSFVRTISYDQVCSKSSDGRWIHCILNQSQPLKFIRGNETFVNIVFIIKSVSNITLPEYFFPDKLYEQYTIRIYATEDRQIERIHILADAFANVVSVSSVHFVLHKCGHPILLIDRHAFRQSSIRQILVTYENRTVSLETFFAEECLSDEKDDESNHYRRDNTMINSIKLVEPDHRLLATMKIIVNGILLFVLILLTGWMMYLAERRNTRRIPYEDKLLLKTLSSPNGPGEDMRTSTTSTIVSTSGSATSGIRHIP